MKHNFLKKLMALLLGTIMVFSMIPAIAIGTKAADTSESLQIFANKGVLAGDTITWSGVNFTVTNKKGSTAIRVSDSDHFRVYANSTTTISATSGLISKVVITATSGSYANVMSGSVKTETKSNNVSGSIVTLEFSEPVESVEIGATAQWRLNKVEVFFAAAETCDHNYEVVSQEDATCTEDGFINYVCSECGGEKSEVLEAGHKMENGVCTVCGASTPTFTKVTSTLDDFSGTYLIVYEAGKLALNGQNVVDGDKNTVDVALENGVITGDYLDYTFTITKDETNYIIQSASGKYIGRASASNGMHISDTEKYTHSNISIDESGNAVITSSGGYVLRFNAASDEMRFRYYNGTQKPIALYKLVEAPAYKGFGITLNHGVTVRVKFNITQEWMDANTEAKVTFSNGTVCDLIVGENYYYTTLTPGQIGDDLTVTLGGVTKTVSVSTYIEKAKAAYATDTKLCALLDAIEAYGMAAEKVEQTLTAPDFNAIADPVVTDKTVIPGFAAATLGEYATVGLTINAEDGYTFVASRGTVSTGKLVLADNLDNGVLYIENIRPANFDDVITVTIYDGDTVVSTIDFTFNSYLKLAYGEAATDLDRNIVIAAYNYGAAASAYVGA
ncbi:MAG: hypothetical protein E7648_03925 [Ruminococcaceae bacterium]|nr:hypothetical protein [Oscillospiraceae bacterium]